MQVSKKISTVILGLLVFIYLVNLTDKFVQASSYLNGNDYAKSATMLVKAKRNMQVYQVKTGKYEVANTFSKYSTLKKGSKIYTSGWKMATGGYTIRSTRKYVASNRSFYIIITDKPTKWYSKIITWHNGTPGFAQGYWHTQNETFWINGTHYWDRISGWNKVGGKKYRFPYHGMEKMRYYKYGNHYVLNGVYTQTGNYSTFNLTRSANHKKLLIKESATSYYTLLSGNR